MTVTRALDSDADERMRSLASVRRAREKLRQQQVSAEPTKIVRDVVIPETITVQELANRMAERSADVIKSLMRMDVMATINQVIDADTAELIVTEFGHKLKRVAEADVEIGLKGEVDVEGNLKSRPPVVTIMGHVDHGKTSLLDALRHTDVAAGEAGGITQHIGAYQVELKGGQRITFIDTPGHQAFTAMRARGANVTDIVVLVVAGDDGIKEQTVEAIRHARAAQVPIIVAINKMDKADANADRVRQELLQHELVVEKLGGDILDVEVSATKKMNLEKLEEAILLQAEILDLKANPDRQSEGVVIEAKLERGRGAVATVLIQRGTLRVGDIFVSGNEWGRVRAIIDERGNNLKEAGPAMPVEVLGLNGAPLAGDDFAVVDSESRARDVTSFRQRRRRDQTAAAGARGTLEQMFSQITAGIAKEFPVLVKSDVQGSLEAIVASLVKLSTGEVAIRVLHSAVGGINESDIILAKASNAVVIGFNVRANPQARDLARRDGVEIRYYSIIYNVIDDMKAALSGMLSPSLRERFLGNAAIREVFAITKVGKVAGCMVTEGTVKRGARVRLLRDNVVIHEGSLKTLKRFKDEVREVKEGYECGMAFENYQDIQAGDVIECFEVEEVARALA
jgi:translation initiation factor IF-2